MRTHGAVEKMPPIHRAEANASDCTCLALRQAARAVSRFYDDILAPSGLRTTQFTLLATLDHSGPVTINALAELLHLDRTTTGKNIRPLSRTGLIQIVLAPEDARQRQASLTAKGRAALRTARPLWSKAQGAFAAHHGDEPTRQLRKTLHHLAQTIAL